MQKVRKDESDIDGFIRLPEVLRLTSLTATTLNRLIAMGVFPLKKRLAAKIVAWKKSEIVYWINSRPSVLNKDKGGGKYDIPRRD